MVSKCLIMKVNYVPAHDLFFRDSSDQAILDFVFQITDSIEFYSAYNAILTRTPRSQI
jgi:hypothetical protein